ncbi:uncharacterized protein Z519_11939 [Cladophialophora bantiana CBS 173.52]|uniref:Uncharacterized protein n=1 Tax=Cladophialophora bantiana (strain ATCC 10958 / CBS 173.52 / CDC B-1940 / NIH 8579) TaxID=1442370 RepID=A0A0D2H1Y6_CLAB1|nr:uncharacterized protein Z519_11939 [Cladophialophora bantiana CBS 173.52]KIW87303.1 hypothetical protein Z519_11939 [Cladophialophora bantiana CBS 173.52]
MTAAANWFCDDNLAIQLKDAYVAEKAITAHQVAALVLSRILRQIIHRRFQGNREVALHLAFHEVDGTFFRGDQYFEKRHCHPDFMPFWEIDAVQIILKEWRWIFRLPCENHGYRVLVALPNIARATLTNAPETEQEAANQCVAALSEAFTPENDPPNEETHLFSPDGDEILPVDQIWLPGFPRPVTIVIESLFAKWLGMWTATNGRYLCFAIRGLLVGVDPNGTIAVLMRTYRLQLQPTESSNDPASQAVDEEKMRPHRAVLLRRPEQTQGVMEW